MMAFWIPEGSANKSSCTLGNVGVLTRQLMSNRLATAPVELKDGQGGYSGRRRGRTCSCPLLRKCSFGHLRRER